MNKDNEMDVLTYILSKNLEEIKTELKESKAILSPI